jgi:chloride channel 3/4/5
MCDFAVHHYERAGEADSLQNHEINRGQAVSVGELGSLERQEERNRATGPHKPGRPLRAVTRPATGIDLLSFPFSSSSAYILEAYALKDVAARKAVRVVRQRLLDIGEDEQSTPQLGEGSSLRRKGPSASYGTLPSHSPARSRFTARLALPSRQSSDTHSLPGQSSALASPTMRSFPGRTSMYFGAERPIAAYDAPLLKDIQRTAAEPISAQVNGLRVWYASFTSIDWLHDAIKDGVRRARMRARKSARGRLLVATDRFVGWLIVTIVGVLTALIAFAIVRAEMTMFDYKEGYCTAGWWKARRFCCPALVEEGLPNFSVSYFDGAFNSTGEEMCPNWRTWSEVFGQAAERRGAWVGLKAEMVEYISYACIAVCPLLLNDGIHSY